MLAESITRAEEQIAQLRIVEEKIDTQTKTCSNILTTVRSGVTYLLVLHVFLQAAANGLRRAQVHLIAIDMRSLLSILHNHILSHEAAPRGLGTHWQQAPVTLEDALGFMIPIPLELVNSWEVRFNCPIQE